MTIALGALYSPFDSIESACLAPVPEFEALMLADAGVREPMLPPKLNLLKAFEASTVAFAVEEVKALLAGVRTPETDVHDCSR